ncbi:R.Pab1 family restriction endonuclease [Helicobacter sp. 11S03491-1]|uniref:R.Pab1 family restriction endonuclease n=1 Tax=Helicobacter sp. 11S03491-1 TaxID=1476196 RepID=UPI000BA669AD|nr:R.Pab1 family restriction endonuclease [Helicobacter sp. 11S03491-1]PAF43047.1 restriction endonuclease [Helicobacter sp. 11S03491-1]
MQIDKLDEINKKIAIDIPLSAPSGKIRVKSRNSFYEYGLPVATRQQIFTQKHYIEWMIGYDVIKKQKEKIALTTLQNTEFMGSNKELKSLYELSEYCYYFKKWGIIKNSEILSLMEFLNKPTINDFLDSNPELEILRTHPKNKKILGIDFYCSEVKYPLLVHPFDKFDILVEIIIREKQRAIGAQPMVYVCFPVTELIEKNNTQLLGRCAKTKEFAHLILDFTHKNLLLGLFKIFGILSPAHNHDVLEILKIINKA